MEDKYIRVPKKAWNISLPGAAAVSGHASRDEIWTFQPPYTAIAENMTRIIYIWGHPSARGYLPDITGLSPPNDYKRPDKDLTINTYK